MAEVPLVAVPGRGTGPGALQEAQGGPGGAVQGDGDEGDLPAEIPGGAQAVADLQVTEGRGAGGAHDGAGGLRRIRVQARGQVQGQHPGPFQGLHPGAGRPLQGQAGAQAEEPVHHPAPEGRGGLPGLGGVAEGPAQAGPEPGLQRRVALPGGLGAQGPHLHLPAAEARQARQGQGVAAVVAGAGQHVEGTLRGQQGQGAQGGMLLEHQGGHAPALDGPVFQGPHFLGGEKRDHAGLQDELG